MKLTIVAGARPNFLKIAPLISELERVRELGVNISYRLVHTGQHYDDRLSRVFFDELGIPLPHVNLEAGSGSQAVQTANIMIGFEQELLNNTCDVVVVVGDVNSTLACSIVAKKLNIKVAHIEAGIRSFDMTMPEEINRLVTDSICDYYFTPTETANENLMRSGVQAGSVYYVGNIMIDSLYANRNRLTEPSIVQELSLHLDKCIILTLHRPHNADDPEQLKSLLDRIVQNSKGHNIIFPVHPRTKKTLDETGFSHENLIVIEPQGYLSFIYLVSRCKAVITDSGGIQEETTVMGVPCVTLRENTERPETVSIGTNELVGNDPDKLESALARIFSGNWKEGAIPDLWDGKTAERIVKTLLSIERFINE
ncbi:MAG: UDP-N-acetylglucosamine 2-epimerase (non-hydrolyzing) [Chitinophagaceae bacterium]|nr:UDP-N-acetylglucosamine 2-epimerase (non-hydrolyzing) [Chitinophagaceae bacterium]MCB9044849.1 UDP-N-acetylglucosamine 2-epimerase (non-hydrolyzing) [Chitinophagales bacterium]